MSVNSAPEPLDGSRESTGSATLSFKFKGADYSTQTLIKISFLHILDCAVS